MQLRLDVENELLPKAAFFLEQPVITVGLQSGDLDGRKHGALLRHEMSHPGARLCTPRSPMVLHPVRQSRGEDMTSAPANGSKALPASKTGSASCRERVCRYV